MRVTPTPDRVVLFPDRVILERSKPGTRERVSVHAGSCAKDLLLLFARFTSIMTSPALSEVEESGF